MVNWGSYLPVAWFLAALTFASAFFAAPSPRQGAPRLPAALASIGFRWCLHRVLRGGCTRKFERKVKVVISFGRDLADVFGQMFTSGLTADKRSS